MASAPKTPSLYARMQIPGTVTETPHDVPDARFALPSTSRPPIDHRNSANKQR
jgi:hypothetical protein